MGSVKHNFLHHFYADFSQVNREGLVFEASPHIYISFTKKTRCLELDQVIKISVAETAQCRVKAFMVNWKLKLFIIHKNVLENPVGK